MQVYAMGGEEEAGEVDEAAELGAWLCAAAMLSTEC
jgi:hypothetical protein